MKNAAKSRRAGLFAPLQTRPSLPTEIAARIAEEIASGRLAPGSQLPPEHVFTAQFGVSRATIREAVAALRSEGLIVPKQGLGTFVANGPLRRSFKINPDDLQSIEDMLQLIELRSSVEVDAAGLAAERRQKPHLDRMAAVLDQIDAAIARKESATELDFEFHRAIADATGNPYFRRFLDSMGPIAIPRDHMSKGLSQAAADPRVYLRRIQAEHRAIQAAIEAGDAAAARRTARVHLSRGRERYSTLQDADNSAESRPAKSVGT